jgi:hypothetical protein
MRALKRPSRGVRTLSVLEDEPGTGHIHDAADRTATDLEETDEFDDEGYGIFRVHCPDCTRPIALLADEQVLPVHALCASPWNPFGLTVCAGSGRAVADGVPLSEQRDAGQDVAVLLTLPAGLDWRTQPFSHAGGAGPRPYRPAA